MRGFFRIISFFLMVSFSSCIGRYPRSLTIIETTDVHGEIFPYDFIEKSGSDASLASVATYLKDIENKDIDLLLLDNGDNLQGQPVEYYYNFIDTTSTHINALVMNWMKYDAGTVGNHDIEAGHRVYDRIRKQYDFPLLAANAVDTKTGQPYFEPYVIFNKNGLKIAILGLITPSIPDWLPPGLYSGITFTDMLETAQKWMPLIMKEKPDLVIGLFHSGWSGPESYDASGSYMIENGSASVAYNVRGFDVIFNGHDHRTANEKIVNRYGDTVLILNGGSRSQYIARADIEMTRDKGSRQKRKLISGSIVKMSDFPPDSRFQNVFSGYQDVVKRYVDRVIGEAEETISAREAYFGPSAFMNLIHEVQIEVSGADISFAAPLSFDVKINKGPITVSDMFKLYRYENMLYTLNLKGEEIIKYLEYSYAEWLNRDVKPDGNLLLFRTDKKGGVELTNGKAYLRNPSYNFDSAYGINYTVDISKPPGERISVISMADGASFESGKIYKVALNSYRANGGGGHLIQGAGITADDLHRRFVDATDLDLRYYIMKAIEKENIVSPKIVNNWEIIPETLSGPLKVRDFNLLFGKD